VYFKHLQPAGPVEILSHRIVWSLLCIALIITAMRRWRIVAALRDEPRKVWLMVGAAVLIAINWGTYLYGVNTDRVVETALGYFITPLVVILLGVGVLRERLRPFQWAAVAVGAVAVAVLTVDYGRLPWIALTLAGSFSLYGLVKKQVGLPPSDGLLLESGVLALPALIYLLVLGDDNTFVSAGSWHTVLLVISGVATVVPLMMFAAAANRVPLYGIGMIQYIAPLLQFSLGVFVFHEPMPAARWAGFALIWLALAVFTVDALGQRRAAVVRGDTLAASVAPVEIDTQTRA
jgi:chloramphenicol-sensitive protein RarD